MSSTSAEDTRTHAVSPLSIFGAAGAGAAGAPGAARVAAAGPCPADELAPLCAATSPVARATKTAANTITIDRVVIVTAQPPCPRGPDQPGSRRPRALSRPAPRFGYALLRPLDE